jgi:hypothetical protein
LRRYTNALDSIKQCLKFTRASLHPGNQASNPGFQSEAVRKSALLQLDRTVEAERLMLSCRDFWCFPTQSAPGRSREIPREISIDEKGETDEKNIIVGCFNHVPGAVDDPGRRHAASR